MKRGTKHIIILIAILFALVYLYSLFNGADSEQTFWQFAKTDGLKALIIVVFVSLGVLILHKVFRVKVRH